MTGPSNLGLEALTFVPDDYHREGEDFYAGLQSTGEVFRFGLSIKSSSLLISVTSIGKLSIEGNHTDLLTFRTIRQATEYFPCMTHSIAQK